MTQLEISLSVILILGILIASVFVFRKKDPLHVKCVLIGQIPLFSVTVMKEGRYREISASEWSISNRDRIKELFSEEKTILFRGFDECFTVNIVEIQTGPDDRLIVKLMKV